MMSGIPNDSPYLDVQGTYTVTTHITRGLLTPLLTGVAYTMPVRGTITGVLSLVISAY